MVTRGDSRWGDTRRYLDGLTSTTDGHLAAHVLVVVPREMKLYEAALRRGGATWLWRYYKPVGRQLLEEAGRLGPTALSEAYRSPWKETSHKGLPEEFRFAAAARMLS
ncbi:MAG: hypothetical protein GY926_12240 [bacterium]|nr:hypothetical protein [bacterium]